MEGFKKISLHDLADTLKDGAFELTYYLPVNGVMPKEWYCPRTQQGAEEWLKDIATICHENGDHSTFIIKMGIWIYIIRRYNDDTWEYLEVVL